MKGHISSLNVSVATAIILYEVMNKRCPLIKGGYILINDEKYLNQQIANMNI